MSLIERADVGRRVGHERRARRDPLAVGAPDVAGVDVEQSVVVVVDERRAHTCPVVEHAGRRRDVLEHDAAVAFAEIAIEVFRPEVVGDQQVLPAVAVVVGPGRREVIAVVAGVEARVARRVDEAAATVVTKEHARRTVARVVIGRGRARLVLAGAEEIGIDAEIEVEEPVAIVVGHRDRRQHTLERLVEAKGVGNDSKSSFAVVEKKERPRAGRQHQILIAVVVDVDEERLRGVVEHPEAGALGNVLERAVATCAIQPIGEPRRLRDVEILEAVAVGVADRHAMMAVRVAREHRVDARHPRIEIDRELPPERLVGAERRAGHLGEDRPRRAAGDVRLGGPLGNAPAGRAAAPGQRPGAHVLGARGRGAIADDVVAHPGAQFVVAPGFSPGDVRRRACRRGGLRRSRRLDRGDHQLDDGDGGEAVDQPPQLRDEPSSVERAIARQRRGADHLERVVRLRGRSVGSAERRSAKVRRQQPVGDEGRSTRPQQLAELAQTRVELDHLHLGGERVVARLELREKRRQRFRCLERGTIDRLRPLGGDATRGQQDQERDEAGVRGSQPRPATDQVDDSQSATC